MSPPIVYEVATPSNHSTMSTVTIVVSTGISFRVAAIVRRVGGCVCSVGYTGVARIRAGATPLTCIKRDSRLPARRIAWGMHIRTGLALVLTVALVIATGTSANAQSFINPFIGYNFGGDATCPSVDNCEDKKLNAGVSLGRMGVLFGIEEEFAYAKDFFGTAPGLSSSVLTVMTNLMFVPKVGPVRPYVLAGVGLIKSHVEFSPSSVLTSDNNNFGWDVGAGVMGFFGPHVGLRGDIRYFHAFQDLALLGFTLSDTKLDFGRASVGLVLAF